MDNNKTVFEINKDELKSYMSRVFDAPVETVFKAYTDPALVTKWFGSREYEAIVDKYEAKTGGEWRLIHKGKKGDEFVFYGIFKEVNPPKSITWTFNYEGLPGDHEIVETMTFEEVDGKTKMTTVSVYQSLEDLEGMISSGMEEGARESLDRLAELVEKS